MSSSSLVFQIRGWQWAAIGLIWFAVFAPVYLLLWWRERVLASRHSGALGAPARSPFTAGHR